MDTIPYLDYEHQRLEGASTALTSPRAIAPPDMSPFDVPERIQFRIPSRDRCVIEFMYPNAEPPEGAPRLASPDGLITAELGRNTHKILKIFVSSARTRFARDGVDIDKELARAWAEGLPAHARLTAIRNTALVIQVLHSISNDFRQRLLREL